MKTVIDIHVIQSLPAHNLNRDSTGAQKSCIYGGSRRVRVSSQSWKRAIRENFNLPADDLAQRTKYIAEAIVPYLVAAGKTEAEALRRTRMAMLIGMGVWLDVDTNKTSYLMFLGNREFAALADVILAQWDTEKWDEIEKTIEAAAKSESKEKGDGLGDYTAKMITAVKKVKSPEKSTLKKEMSKALDGGKAVDLSLFGRMLADMSDKTRYAAAQVAHVISTHSVEREYDYWTALDDRQKSEETGSSHLGHREYSAACYYRYSDVNWDLHVTNMQADIDAAKAGIREYLRAFVLSIPSGSQNGYAAHSPASTVVISVRHDTAPQNWIGAFESPVNPHAAAVSLAELSTQKMLDKAQVLQRMYGTGPQDHTWILTEFDGLTVPDTMTLADNLDDMINNVIAAL